MVESVSLEELLSAGAPIAPHEAVAVVQQLLTTHSEDREETAVSPQDVMLDADGGVRGRGGLPSVEGIGRLLDTMLPCGNGRRVTGALRLTIARACNSVDAPPFTSPCELSKALERFETGRRENVVRELLLRTVLVSAPSAPDQRADRRRQACASDLRRELLKADERIFELLQGVPHVPHVPTPQPRAAAAARLPARWAAVAVAAVLGSFAAGYAATEWLTASPPTEATAAQTSIARP